METDTTILEFFDANGRSAGKLLIIAEKEQKTIEILTAEESRESGEEAVQLREGYVYEYELTEATFGHRLRENEVVIRSSIPNKPQSNDRGRIEPGSHTGMLPLVLEDRSGRTVASVAVEVQSYKLNYRVEYRQMMDYIADKCTALLMEMRAPSQARFISDPGSDLQTIQERFAFLKSVLDSKEFHDALQRIIALPHQYLKIEPYERKITQGFKPNSNSLRQIARGTPRIPLPPTHPLAIRMRMRANTLTEPSLPAKITTFRNRETVDTPENRFVKHTLREYINFLFKIEKALSGKSKAELRLRREVSQLQETLEVALSQPFFREISEPDLLPLGSPVLQRKSGYCELLQTWLKFNLASRLVWHGGDDVYGIGKRDMAVLYEYWLFFQLLDLASSQFDLKEHTVDNLIEATPDGFGLKLKSGKPLVLQGRYSDGPRLLQVRFNYNRTFKGANGRLQDGSWTLDMRPDFSFSFWPEEFTPDEAEQQELMVHIHFDAKYKAESIKDLFGSNGDDLQTEREEQRSRTYKRADLLKMHAYHDAIRRSEGAYILYPGNDIQIWYGFHEILPSLGAFAVRPTENGKANGIEHISMFLQNVMNHLCDRAARRERVRYHLYEAQQEPDPLKIGVQIPELIYGTRKREVPPIEHWVLVGRYENFACLRWMLRENLYSFQAGNTLQSLRLRPEFAQARHLLLFTIGPEPLAGLWRMKELGPRLLTQAELIALQYPGTLIPSAIYAVYDVEPDYQFKGKKWREDIETLNKASSFPFVTTLDQILAFVK